MNSTVILRPILIENHISEVRLKSYKTVFQTKSDQELIGAYLWNMNVCSEIYPLITAAEITLRNAIDKALVADLGYFWWKKSKLRYNSFNPSPAHISPVCFQKISNNFSSAAIAVSHEKFARYQSKARPSHDEIIAKTELSTWEFILDQEFLGPNLIWPKNLSKVFLGPWPTQKGGTSLTAIKNLVNTVRLFRNRVFHHEPAWKRAGVFSAHDAVQHLHDKINTITNLIGIISPEKLNLLNESKLIINAQQACALSEIQRFQNVCNFGIK